jgi:hypothetical protein
MSPPQRAAWARSVSKSFSTRVKENNVCVILLAGDTYRCRLEHLLMAKGYECVAPLRDLVIGQQFRWLETAVAEIPRYRDMQMLYRILALLHNSPGQFVRLADLDPRPMPEKGVYFFFDPRERSRVSGKLPRLVRVGTHAVSAGSRATLWQRLRTHRGTSSTGGNHRSSIFRLHVGSALLALSNSTMTSWGKGQDAPSSIRRQEIELENEVSSYLGDLLVAYIAISDIADPNSDRSYIERNTIALITGAGLIDAPEPQWLGTRSPTKAIRESGLWNVNYVGDEYEPAFLRVLESYVLATIGKAPSIEASIAPRGWRSRLASRDRNQLSLELL